MDFSNVEAALEEIRTGRMVILVDDEDRENEGDLTMAASAVTPAAINFMARHGRGLICLTLTDQRIQQLDLPMMVAKNEAPLGTAFTVSIEARKGVTTGISAADRAHTIQVAVAANAAATDLVRPGHIFPLRARPGGVLVRTGQTEGSVDLARLAGLEPAGVICEIMKEDGTMARRPDLEVFGQTHGLRIVSVAEICAYRLQTELLVHRVLERDVSNARWGAMKVIVYGTDVDELQHMALVKGDIHPDDVVPARVHLAVEPADVFEGLLGRSGRDLRGAMDFIAAEGRGVLVYLSKAWGAAPLNERIVRQLDDVQPVPDKDRDLREVGVGSQILRDVGARNIRIMTNHPRKLVAIEGFGIHVVEAMDVPEPSAS